MTIILGKHTHTQGQWVYPANSLDYVSVPSQEEPSVWCFSLCLSHSLLFSKFTHIIIAVQSLISGYTRVRKTLFHIYTVYVWYVPTVWESPSYILLPNQSNIYFLYIEWMYGVLRSDIINRQSGTYTAVYDDEFVIIHSERAKFLLNSQLCCDDFYQAGELWVVCEITGSVFLSIYFSLSLSLSVTICFVMFK